MCGDGVFTISVAPAGNVTGVPHCPQNTSSWPTSLPHLGHLILKSSSWLRIYVLCTKANIRKYSYDSVHYTVFARILLALWAIWVWLMMSLFSAALFGYNTSKSLNDGGLKVYEAKKENLYDA